MRGWLLVSMLGLYGCTALNPVTTGDSAPPTLLSSDLAEPTASDPEAPSSLPPPTSPPPAHALQTEPGADLAAAELPAGVCDREAQPDLTRNIEWDMWERIRGGMRLGNYTQPRVQIEREWFARNQPFIDRVTERATLYLHHIVTEVERRDMPTEIALLPIVESAFQPFAYSHGRAAGIWQFIPSTGRLYGMHQDWWYDGRRDILASTDGALEYLTRLKDAFDGDWLLALAAYNSGAGTVRKAIRKNRQAGKPTDFWSLKLPLETRGYVPRLLAIAELVAEPQRYGIVFPPIADQPYFATVALDSQIDLALAAEFAEVSLDELYRLNPAFNQWATDPDGPHRLLLPVDRVGQFRDRLAEWPASQRVTWQRHRIRPGESLIAIASRYQTVPDILRKTNGLRGNSIRAGEHLLVPVASRKLATYKLSAPQRLRAIQETDRTGRRVVYTTREGDTLWDLARRFDVPVRGLAAWNGMAPTDPLASGRELVVWLPVDLARELVRDDALQFGSADRQSTATVRNILYKVRRGDSLARISQRFGVSVEDLRRWNSLEDGERLKPGQRLNLRVDVTRPASAG